MIVRPAPAVAGRRGHRTGRRFDPALIEAPFVVLAVLLSEPGLLGAWNTVAKDTLHEIHRRVGVVFQDPDLSGGQRRRVAPARHRLELRYGSTLT